MKNWKQNVEQRFFLYLFAIICSFNQPSVRLQAYYDCTQSSFHTILRQVQKEVTLRWNKWPNNCNNETRSSLVSRENLIGCTDVSQEVHKGMSRKTCIKLQVCSVGETARESTGCRIWNLSSPSSLAIYYRAAHVNPRRWRDRKADGNAQKVSQNRIASWTFTADRYSCSCIISMYISKGEMSFDLTV